MTTPTQILRDEHVLILGALDALERAADRLERFGAAPPDAWWAEMVGWLRAFADQGHHAKEERLLFPAMARAGVPADGGGPIGAMLAEHEEGRALVRVIAGSDGPRRAAAVRRYVDLLRAHIDKENDVLFPLADSVLDAEAQRDLARRFATIEDELGRVTSTSRADSALAGLAASLAVSP